MSARQNSKLSIIGAGSVGTSLAYAALIRGSADVVALNDINVTKVEAEVADLAHGTQFTPSVVMGGADLDVVEGSDVVVITAGAKQHPGETRLDLASTNTKILESLMPKLLEQAPDALYVLVTNPCDVLTVVAQKISGLPTGRVFSTGTLLDSSRLRYLIGSKIGINQRNVHVTIAGEHGDSEFPLWSSGRIGDIPLREWRLDGQPVFTDELLADLGHQAATAAYSIIEGKGATNYAIGLAGARLVEALLGASRQILPLSSVLTGQYGLEGVALSLPCVVSSRGIEEVLTPELDATEAELLQRSAQTLQQTLRSVGH